MTGTVVPYSSSATAEPMTRIRSGSPSRMAAGAVPARTDSARTDADERTSSIGHDDDASGQVGAALRVMDVDERARRRIHPTPQAEAIREDERSADDAHRSIQSASSRTTRPATAEAMHSSVEPKTTSAPMLPGA